MITNIDEYKYPVSSSKGRGPCIPGRDLSSEGEPASSCEQSCEETRSRSRSSIPWQREESLALGFDISIGPCFYYLYTVQSRFMLVCIWRTWSTTCSLIVNTVA
ncbi:hypothetical protein PRUPE_1G421000 [Prunus persica]|uniref:Uncharacterized protein n=1 Tax=Prunus persica TaxID=3760 RepID=A0A251RBE3_PRUPE|nr:hypothetical protein PRUPE_1G421000 [Prunus persica]